MSEEYTGGSSSYYDLFIPELGEVKCLDIIEGLDLTYAEGSVLKAVWRIAAARQGKHKKGNTSVYDAEKIVFFGPRILEKEQNG